MSTKEEAAYPEHWAVRDRYQATPKVESWDDAVELVEYLLREIGTYPEKVTVCNLDGIPPERLAGMQALTIEDLAGRVNGHERRYTLTRDQALKAQAVWQEVHSCLGAMNAWPRIPLEMALRFDSGAVTPLWGERVLQLIPESEPAE